MYPLCGISFMVLRWGAFSGARTVDLQQLQHGCRMVYAGFSLSLVWGWRTFMFQLYGLYCNHHRLRLCCLLALSLHCLGHVLLPVAAPLTTFRMTLSIAIRTIRLPAQQACQRCFNGCQYDGPSLLIQL